MKNGNGNGALIVHPDQLPAPKNQGAKWIVESVDRLSRMLPSAVEPKQFAANLVAAANGLEKKCDPKSVIISAFNAAQIGLTVGGPLGHAYFVPFWNKDTGQNDCQLITGYQGFLELSLSAGFLKSVYADVQLRGEDFEHYIDETGPKMRHQPGEDRVFQFTNIVRAYAVWTTRTGGTGVKVVSRKELEAVYKPKSPAWRNNPAPMCAKTALIRASKWWQKTARLARAVELDEQHEMGVAQSSAIELAAETIEADPPSSLSDYDVPDDGSLAEWEKVAVTLEAEIDSVAPSEFDGLRKKIAAADIPAANKRELVAALDARLATQ